MVLKKVTFIRVGSRGWWLDMSVLLEQLRIQNLHLIPHIKSPFILIWHISTYLYDGYEILYMAEIKHLLAAAGSVMKPTLKSSETKISFKAGNKDINRHTQASSAASLAHQTTYSLVLNTNITRTTGATFSFDIHGDLSLCYTLAMQISHNLFDRVQSRSTSIKQSSSHILSTERLRGSPLRSY